MTVTLEDLQSGRRARLNQRETAMLTGRGAASLERDRWKGKGMPFSKDENGRVWYAAEDILQYINRPKYKSTSNYPADANLAKMELARSARSGNQS